MNRDPSKYRPCVGICLFDAKGRVWIGRRYGETGPKSWQFPQGGLDAGESAEFGALRELWEETGVTIAQLSPLGEVEDWLYYDFPPDMAPKKGRLYAGQKQRWFAYRFHGNASHVNLTTYGSQEFSEWKWVKLHKTPAKVIPFKRDVYERLVIEFTQYAVPKS